MKKNILIIDDSALMRRLLSDIIATDNRFEVKDYAADGVAGLELIVSNTALYDVILLDVNMPRMNGLEVLSELRKRKIKCKVVMVSTAVNQGANETIIALERGAFDFILKPLSSKPDVRAEFREKIIHSLEVAAGIEQFERPSVHHQLKERLQMNSNKKNGLNRKLVAIACSTGGPKSLKEVIPYLPKDIDAPIVLVQHMPAGFTNSLAQRLNELSNIRVKEAVHGEELQKGCVYIAPGGKQFRIQKGIKGNDTISLSDEPPREGLRPCANIMYESLVDLDYELITCVVLTGMGSDGTIGIDKLGQNKNIHVIAQNEATSVVYGMPRAIINAGLTDEVLPLDKIAGAILKNVGVLSDGR